MEDKKKLRLAIAFIVLTMLVTMTFVHFAEGWSWVDSFYFSGVTMATVGYGDLTPTHSATKIFITFDILFSVGLFLYSLSLIAELRVKDASKWKAPVDAIPREINNAVKRIQTIRQAEKLPEHKRRMREIFASRDERTWLEQEKKVKVHPLEEKYVPLRVQKNQESPRSHLQEHESSQENQVPAKYQVKKTMRSVRK